MACLAEAMSAFIGGSNGVFEQLRERFNLAQRYLKIERGYVNELGEPLGARGARVLGLEQLFEGFDRPLRSLLQPGANEILERAHEQLPFRQFEAEDHLRRSGGLL